MPLAYEEQLPVYSEQSSVARIRKTSAISQLSSEM